MNKKGFTIIEILVVVSVLTILVVLVLVNINTTSSQTRDRVRISNIQEIRLAIESYRAKCGEYPNQLDRSADNGCPSGTTLGTFIYEIPTNLDYSEEPLFYGDGQYDEGDSYDGYIYAALTNSIGGKCFEYHIGVPIESGWDGEEYRQGDTFSNDHDCPSVTLASEPYNRTCASSADDFDGDDDVSYGIYDMRSANTCS